MCLWSQLKYLLWIQRLFQEMAAAIEGIINHLPLGCCWTDVCCLRHAPQCQAWAWIIFYTEWSQTQKGWWVEMTHQHSHVEVNRKGLSAVPTKLKEAFVTAARRKKLFLCEMQTIQTELQNLSGSGRRSTNIRMMQRNFKDYEVWQLSGN